MSSDSSTDTILGGSRSRNLATHPLLWGLITFYLVWGSLYIVRTSFVADGERIFCLWDDAMVSMQYARNLREGHGLVWIPGEEPVQGFTNLGVTLVMAVIHLLPVGETRVSLVVQVLNLVLLGVVLYLVWRIAGWIYAERGAALAAAVGFALCGPVAIWGLQGSDVGFVTLWLIACVSLVARQAAADDRWPRLVFPLLAVGPWLRPTLRFSRRCFSS